MNIDRHTRVIEQGGTQVVASELLTSTGVRVLVFEGSSGQHVTSLYPRDWHTLTDNALLALLDIARLHTKRLSQQLL
ncbi:MAG: hypothetical protein V4617_04600 [Gemmatimonadota bacterium]